MDSKADKESTLGEVLGSSFSFGYSWVACNWVNLVTVVFQPISQTFKAWVIFPWAEHKRANKFHEGTLLGLIVMDLFKYSMADEI